MRRIILLFCVVLSPILSLPVTRTTKKPVEEPENLQNNLEYERYMREIVEALETDPDFRVKMDTASEDDIRTGNIAHELEFVNHKVRTKLDEIKRQEIERLRALVKQRLQMNNNIDAEHLKIASSLAHVDHENVDTFEIRDLQKLIFKVSEDLSAADKQRREEFKQYELEKEFEKQEKLRGYSEDSRPEHEAEYEKLQQKHNQHEKIHHPGNKAQLEEVWEEQDHMKGMDFDPQTFFLMHDLDSNGALDHNEVKALFIKELDKIYQEGLPEDDMRERVEEMERMREHVFSEIDKNNDGLIDYKEFIDQTKRDEFQKDPGWDTVDTEKVYTHEEYMEFERRRQEEIQRMMAEHPERYPNQQQNAHHQQQNNNQHLDQQHLNQQQQYQNQQQQQQYQGQQQQQQQQQQNNQIPQQNNNQFQQQKQPIPPQDQPPQQKPLSQSSNSNQVNSKGEKSTEQKSNHGQQPQVIQPQH